MYTPHTKEEIKEMLQTIGVARIEDLFSSIPKDLRSASKLGLPKGLSEQGVMSHLNALSSENKTLSSCASFIGAGAYRHYIPAAVSELASRSEFVTPYTPYQPEISQGTLQTLFEYQSQICRLFEMDVSNASHYSGATACADAVLMARRIKKGRNAVVVPNNIHPEYRDVLRAVLGGHEDIKLLKSPDGCIDRKSLTSAVDEKTAAVIVQYPNFFGVVEDLKDVAEIAHRSGALLIAVVPEPIALGILKPPGVWGADIAVGEGLSLGLPVSFGGPTLGIFTTRNEFVRQMPGRVSGRTVDANGRTGYVLTLSTREQHIRREKATSNICSNEALCATQAAIYLSLLGKNGLAKLARVNAGKAIYAKERLGLVKGVKIKFAAPTFNEFVIELPIKASRVLADLAGDGILGGVGLGLWYPELNNCILVCVTELNTRDEIDKYIGALNQRTNGLTDQRTGL